MSQVIAKYNIVSWDRQAPDHIRQALKQYHSQINAPSIGCLENYTHYSYQLNVARPQHVSSGMCRCSLISLVLIFVVEKSLKEQMGHFGGPHRDIRDCVAALSCALVLSDIPEGWEPGRLHLLGLGIFASLPLYRQFFFTGQHQHGGTSPLAPNDEPIPDWAYRLIMIAYPPTAFVLGNLKHSFAPVPHSREPFYLSQEMTGAPHTPDPDGIWSQRSNYAHDGQVVMEPRALFQFYARGLLQMNNLFLAQLPSSFGIQVDPEAFLRSISMTTPEGTFTADNWTEAPRGNVQQRYGEAHKAVQDAVLRDLYDHMVRGIPGVRGPNPFESFDVSSNHHGRPYSENIFSQVAIYLADAFVDYKSGTKRPAPNHPDSHTQPSKRMSVKHL